MKHDNVEFSISNNREQALYCEKCDRIQTRLFDRIDKKHGCSSEGCNNILVHISIVEPEKEPLNGWQ